MRDDGFVFTIDSMVGAAIIAFALLTFTLTVEQPQAEDVFLERLATDTALVLEERGTIGTKDKTTINDTIRELLPSEVMYDYRVEYFTVASDGSLTLDQTIKGNMVASGEDVVYAMRPVPIMKNETTESTVKNMTEIAKVRLGVSL